MTLRNIGRLIALIAVVLLALGLASCIQPFETDLFQEISDAVRESVPHPPTAPTGLLALPSQPTQVDLSWTDTSDNEDEFQIQRRAGVGVDWQTVDTVGPDSTAYYDETVDPETTYIYRVRAANEVGGSDWSGEAAVTTPALQTFRVIYHGNHADDGSPPVDSNLYHEGDMVTISGPGTLGLTGNTFAGWNTASDGTGSAHSPGSSYEMQAVDVTFYAQWTVSSYTLTVEAGVGGSIITPSSHEVTVTHGVAYAVSAAPDSGFEFDLWSVTAGTATIADTESASTTVTLFDGNATVRASFADVEAPDPPTINGIVAGTYNTPQSFTIGGEAGAFIEYSLDGGAGWQEYTGEVNLTNEGTYTVTARQTDGAGNTSSSATPVVVTIAYPPSPPASVTATAQSPSAIHISWVDTSDDETSFEIQRIRTGDVDYVTLDDSLPPDTTSYQDDGLLSETEYRYRVRAANGMGNSSWSTEAIATTAELAAPSGLDATASSCTEISLTWVDNSGSEDGFQIRITGGGSTVYVDKSANATSHDFSGLKPVTTYTFDVRAFDAGGTSAYSDFTSETTLTPWEISTTGSVTERRNDYVLTNTYESYSVTLKSCPGGSFPRADGGGAVTVDALWAGETEVTNRLAATVFQWAYDTGRTSSEIAGASPYISFSGGIFTVTSGYEDYPCSTISWFEAIKFCNWLTEYVDGDDSNVVYTIGDYVEDTVVDETQSGFRLPNRDEWECAARWLIEDNGMNDGYFHYGGGYSYGGIFWHYGDECSGVIWGPTGPTPTGDLAWYSANSGNVVHEVATRGDNWLEIYDMNGNVSEWCSDTWEHPITLELMFWARGGAYNSPVALMCTEESGDWYANVSDRGFRVFKTP
jgi:hypothetical protein